MSDRIRFGEPIEPQIPGETLPPRHLLARSAGRWRDAPFQVYIVQDVYAKIWQHVNETPTIESGGVLVGHPFQTFDGKTIFVVVTAAIPQQSDNRSAGHFTVGTDEIRAARKEMEQKYPGLTAVGWYHSHPGHGVFLSGQDMSIVRSIYDASWHIAMVIDPQRRTEGIFVGPEGEQLGGQGNKALNESWIGLRQALDGVKAIALYNQAHEQLNEGHPEQALDLLEELDGLVEESSELTHWRERGGYRDAAKMRIRAREMPERERLPESRAEQDIEPRRPLPEPARIGRRRGWPPRYWWLLFSSFLAGVFAVFVFTSTVRGENWGYWITLGWGVLISLLTIVLSGFVVLARERIDIEQSGVYQRSAYSAYSAGERIMGLLLIGLVLVLWGSYGFSRGRLASAPPKIPSPTSQQEATVSELPVIVSPSVTATFTDTPMPTPTSTCTPTPTDTPTPSPTSTNTPTPTFTPTWTPTATLMVTTPLIGETVTPTVTLVITPTGLITP
jgi:proteasome lid subunit RPN8/RPN11